MRLLIVIALLFVFGGAADAGNSKPAVYAGPSTGYEGFLSGEEFLSLSEVERASYAMGILDGFLGAGLFGAEDKYVRWIHECIHGWTNSQVAAILERQLRDNPKQWNQRTSVVLLLALAHSCE